MVPGIFNPPNLYLPLAFIDLIGFKAFQESYTTADSDKFLPNAENNTLLLFFVNSVPHWQLILAAQPGWSTLIRSADHTHACRPQLGIKEWNLWHRSPLMSPVSHLSLNARDTFPDHSPPAVCVCVHNTFNSDKSAREKQNLQVSHFNTMVLQAFYFKWRLGLSWHFWHNFGWRN